MTTLQKQQPITPETTASVRTAPKATLLTAGEHLPHYPIIQPIHTLEKSTSEMSFQKGSMVAQILFEKGLISQSEKDNIIRYFSATFHPELESLIS